jgi:hypothetical protein
MLACASFTVGRPVSQFDIDLPSLEVLNDCVGKVADADCTFLEQVGSPGRCQTPLVREQRPYSLTLCKNGP